MTGEHASRSWRFILTTCSITGLRIASFLRPLLEAQQNRDFVR